MSKVIDNIEDIASIDSKSTISYVDSKPTGFKNYIINGNFDVWQRGTIFNIPAGQSAFIADRFFVVNTSNQTVTAEKGIVNEGINGRLVNRLRISYATAPTSGAVQIAQKIEDVTRIVGSNTSSVYIGSNESITITQDITQNFGSGGSSSVVTSGSSFQSNSQINRFSSIYSIPTTANKTIGDSNFTQLTYALPIRTTNAVTFTLLQLEEGSVATPFEQRPYGLELSLCQKYLPSFVGFAGTGTVRTSTTAAITIPFKVEPRVPPTGMTVSGYATIENGGTWNEMTGSFSSARRTAANTLWTNMAASMTLGQGCMLNTGANTILFTGCEL